MAFLRLCKSFQSILKTAMIVQDFNPLSWIIESIAIACAALVFCLFQKPPDKVFCFETFVIEVKSRRWWFYLLLFTVLTNVLSLLSMGIPTKLFPSNNDEVTNIKKEHIDEMVDTVLDSLNINNTNDVHSFVVNQRGKDNARDIGNWDSDDFPIVDSATSRPITPFFEDLIDPRPYETNLKGIGNGKITHVGTVRWAVQDINGRTAYIEDPETYYSRYAPNRLLRPHSWRESLNNKRYANGETEGEGATMCLDPNDKGGYILSWNRGRTVVQAPLDREANLPTIRGRPSYAKFKTFATAFQCYDDDDENEQQDRHETTALPN